MPEWLKEVMISIPRAGMEGLQDKHILRAALDEVAETKVPADHLFPRVNRFEYEGRLYYLRLYWLRYTHTAACYIWAMKKGAKLGLKVPPVRGVSLARIHARICICVLEEALKGDFVRKWDGEISADLGDGMAVWHSIKSTPWFVRRGFGHKGWYTRYFRKLLTSKPDSGEEFSAEQRELLDLALEWLDDEKFIGRIGVSHGDLHNGNLLRVENDGVGWLDLDAVRYQPVRHDMAAAEMGLMFRAPEVIDRFEERYFARLPDEFKGWRRFRRKWFVFFNLLRAMKYLVGNPRLPGQRDRGLAERRRHSDKHFAFAQAAHNIPGYGVSSAELVRQIVLKSGVYDDELEDDYWR